MTALTELTIAEARDALRAGEVTATELTDAHLAAIDGAAALNAFVHHTPEIARAQASEADARLKTGDAPAMCGIPIGVKDLFCTRGVPSQAGSRILDGFEPDYESTITERLFGAGAVMLGKLNMDEFAMGSSNETSTYGDAVNPWRAGDSDAKLTPGGSSGGSASAVAARLCLAALGTDTGGSIRQPAAFTGITGLKPTYGRCSRWGIVAFASSLDQAGPMARSVQDCAILLGAMAGHDPKDSTSADLAVPDFEAMATGDIKGQVIGIPREYRMDGMPDEIEALWQEGIAMLRDAGAEMRDITLPHTKYALPAYYVIAPAEASSNLARYDGVRFGRRAALAQGDGITEMYEKTRAEGFGPEVQAPRHGRHLRPLGGLLRRLLQPRPQGPHPHRARFRDGLRRGRRRDPDTRHPVGGLRARRARRCRPDPDVSQRRLHRDREPRRPPGHRGAHGPRRAGPSARAATHRQALGRRRAPQRRPGARGTRGLRGATRALVVRFGIG